MCDTYDTFNQVIANRYGAEWLSKVRMFARLRTKCKKLEYGLRYTVQCRDNGLIPKFSRISSVKCIRDYEEFFRIANEKLLRRVISDYRSKLMIANKNLYHLHLLLANTLHKDLWETLDAMSYSRTDSIERQIQKRHEKKFQNLKKTKADGTYTDPSIIKIRAGTHSTQNVINLSSQEINEVTIKALSRGMNFAPAPRNIPVENIITSIEDTLMRNHIPFQNAECLRQDIATMLRKAKPPKSNMPKIEMEALKSLKNNTELLVLPADKGNATVVLDTQEYESKMKALICDTTTYKKVNYNPTSRITDKVIKLLQQADDADLTTRLRPYNPTSPKIYGVPKIHKPNWPLRPIVSQIDAPTYKLSRHMATILKRFTCKTDSHVTDSRHFVHLLSDVRILPTEIMVSFDVASLFTNVPVDDTIAIIKDLILDAGLPNEYINWTEYCLRSGYFMWQGDHYLQLEGVAMGSPMAPVVANIFMEWFEQRAMEGTLAKPRYWWRYVDDIFAVVATDKLAPLTDHLNKMHPKITITVEKENDGQLPFLDVLVIREPNGTVSHTVFRKQTHTDRYLSANSHHHPSQLASVPKSLINRALELCDPKHVHNELDHLKYVLENNGYSWRQCSRWASKTERKRNVSVDRVPAYLPFIRGVTDKIGYLLRRKYSIRTIFRPPGQLRRLLRTPKDREPLSTAGVYRIPCDCGSSYIGETRRNVATRLAEHIRSVKNGDTKSAVAEHAQMTTHFLRFDQASVLAREKFLVPRKVREAIEINRHANFNRDRGWNLAAAWKPVLNSTRNLNVEEHAQDTISSVCTGLCLTDSEHSDSDNNELTQPIQQTARGVRARVREARRNPPPTHTQPAATVPRRAPERTHRS